MLPERNRIMKATPAVIAALWLGVSASAQAATADLEFAIKRNGEQIGTYAVHMAQTGAETTVKTAVNLAVKKLLVTWYHREQNCTERWVNGELVAFSSTTDDNGTKHKVEAAAKGTAVELQADGTPMQADRNIVPISLWNPALARRSVGFDAMDGKVMPITVADHGVEDIVAAGHPVKAHHYTVNGTFSNDVWYDTQGHLVHVEFVVARDGSTITYDLASAELSPARVATPVQPGKPK
jgi:hypothetical protein